MEQIEKYATKRDLHKGVIAEFPATPESKIFSLGSTKMLDPWYSNPVVYSGIAGTFILGLLVSAALKDIVPILPILSIGVPAFLAPMASFCFFAYKQDKREKVLTQKLAHQQVEALSQWLKVRYGIVVDELVVKTIISRTTFSQNIIQFQDNKGVDYSLIYYNGEGQQGYMLEKPNKVTTIVDSLVSDETDVCWKEVPADIQEEMSLLKQNMVLLDDKKLTPEQSLRNERVRINYVELVDTINQLTGMSESNAIDYVSIHKVLTKLKEESSSLLEEIRSSLTKRIKVQDEYLLSALQGKGSSLQVDY